MDWLSVIAVLYVALTALSLVSEGWRAVRESSALVMAFFTVLLILVGYIMYVLLTGEPTDDAVDAADVTATVAAGAGAAGGGANAKNVGAWWHDRDLITDPRSTPPEVDTLELVPDVDVHLVPGVAPKSPSSNTITYAVFKDLITQSEYIQKFTNSIVTCLRLKQDRYKEMRAAALRDIKAYTKSSKNNPITDMVEESRNHQLNDARDLKDRIDKILSIITQRLARASPEDTAKRLQYALYKKEVGMESLQGRTEIKDLIALKLHAFCQNPNTFLSGFQNIILMAGPGSGKTRIAQVIGHVYGCAGILVEGTATIKTKADLVSPYVDDTAHMTRSFLYAMLEKVATIDEAYALVPPKSPLGNLGGHQDHGHEAVAEIVNHLDKTMGLSVLIAIGYEDAMHATFLAANEGMPRRFPDQWVLPPYTTEELAKILVRKMYETNKDLVWYDDMSNFVYTLISKVQPDRFPDQAGSMGNLAKALSLEIHGAVGAPWPEHWQQRITDGFNSYLSKANEHFTTPAI